MQIAHSAYDEAMVDTVASRIRERLETLNLSARKAALLAGLPEARVRDILNSKSQNPRADTLAALAPVLQTSVGWLATSDASPDPSAIIKTQRLGATRSLPIRFQVEAGAWRETEDIDEPYGSAVVPIDHRFGQAHQWLEQVVGDSMNLLIPEGSLVHVIDALDIGYEAQHGHIVVVERRRFSGQLRERSVKQVERLGTALELWPRSTNPKWNAPLKLDEFADGESGVEVQIVGLVVQQVKVWV